MLKSSDIQNEWQGLLYTCDILNNSSLANLPSLIASVLDADRALWFLTSEILFSDDDSYIYKGKMDYYVYQDAETGRINMQEYDGNSVMKTNNQSWSPFYNQTNANYPLMNRLFTVPGYRQHYLAHLRTLINEYFTTSSANAVIDAYKNQVATMVQNDPKK